MTSTAVPSRDAFDLAMVARRKAELGLSCSVVIPALDEGPRVGAVVTAIRAAMIPVPGSSDHGPDVPIVDELVVVDGGSDDDTVARAAAAGARVVHQSAEDGPGKGAALRRGVAATTGELIAFVDADVHTPDPWLAVGTLAPLILDERLRLVKSAAQRAWWTGGAADGVGGTSGTGGGRVTELTVRPLLALLWPELAHVAQPLAGEYAADRALLEQLPFERGYGVELGLLLDTARHCGAEAIGQVDLGLRAHEHQPLAALGRMAAELVLVMADRLTKEGRPLGTGALDLLLLPQPERDEDGTLTSVPRTVVREALPPLVATGVSGGPLPARRGPSPRR
jgi:glucosyl-3-phosphoglycerate synthase